MNIAHNRTPKNTNDAESHFHAAVTTSNHPSFQLSPNATTEPLIKTSYNKICVLFDKAGISSYFNRYRINYFIYQKDILISAQVDFFGSLSSKPLALLTKHTDLSDSVNSFIRRAYELRKSPELIEAFTDFLASAKHLHSEHIYNGNRALANIFVIKAPDEP